MEEQCEEGAKNLETRSRPTIDPELKRFIGVLETFQNLGADKVLMSDLAEKFLQFYPQQVGRIARALDSRDADELELALSELAEAAENFQAPSLARLTTDLAELGKHENPQLAKAGWQELTGKYQFLLRAIERFVRVACRRPGHPKTKVS